MFWHKLNTKLLASLLSWGRYITDLSNIANCEVQTQTTYQNIG